MFSQIYKFLLTLSYPPYRNGFELFLNKLLLPKSEQTKIKLIDNTEVVKYLTYIPSTDVIITHSEAISFYKAVFFLNVPGNIVEIGTWRGGSAIVLASALKDSGSKKILHTIDPYTSERDRESKKFFVKDIKTLGLKNLFENYRYSKNLVNKFGLKSYLVFHLKKSDEVAKGWKKKVSFVFIDGNHAFSSVKSDIEHWGKFLPPGGLIAVHDYKNNVSPIKGFQGPTRAVDKYLRNSKDWTFCGQIDSLIYFRKKVQ